MSLFRELANAVREQMDLARAQSQPPIRPTSIYAAGATGEPDQQRPRSPSSPARDIAARREGRNIYPEGPIPNNEASARRRPPVATRQVPQGDSRAALLTALRSPASLRTAILVREILDPPVALRGNDSPGGGGGNPGSPNS
ncbi:MAG: hypothetical protein H0V37_09110 [Chloroflexia bacterium]|nr:hypothetical protein [Chloroflexia bacterium]